MAQTTGYDTLAGVKIASTWGTATACGAGDKLIAEITPNENSTVIQKRNIGLSKAMVDAQLRGNSIPTVGLAMDGRYDDVMAVILAQFFGTAGAPVSLGGGEYRHELYFNPTLNAKYLTTAWLDSSGTTYEIPTAACRSFTFATGDIPGKTNFTCELLGGEVSLSSSTNTSVTLASVTTTDSELIVAASDDECFINAQSGATLSSGDNLEISGFSVSLNRPQEIIPTINSSAIVNPAPLSTGDFNGQVTVTLPSQADHTWWTAWSTETIYKMTFKIQGTTISARRKYFYWFFPALQLVQAPQRPVSGPGVLPVTLTFRCIKAATAPSGITSTYPSVYILNTRSTDLLA